MRELSEQNPIIKRIMRNLPINMLMRHLTRCYKNYQTLYHEEYTIEIFEKGQQSPPDGIIENQTKKLEYETIIENGFYIFFLIC